MENLKNNSSSRKNYIGEPSSLNNALVHQQYILGAKVWQLVDMIGVSSLLFLWKAKNLQYV